MPLNLVGQSRLDGKSANATHLCSCRYQTTVATLSRRARDVIEAAFEKSVDAGRDSPLIQSRLHDFGMRGCTCIEQSVLGGVAHFLSFEGSDTMSAGYYAQVSACISFRYDESASQAASVPWSVQMAGGRSICHSRATVDWTDTPALN